MRAVYSFIIEPVEGKLYNNVKIVNGKEFYVSTGIEGHQTTNRNAIVKSIPSSYIGPVSDGDYVVVHHNVFRKAKNLQGVEHFSSGHVRDDIYLADEIEVFAYRSSQDTPWAPIEPFCFVEPIMSEDDTNNKSEVELHGIMKYVPNALIERGINEGDHVIFTPDSEYEFLLDGIRLYKMNIDNICLKL